jgi:hypothetical protein
MPKWTVIVEERELPARPLVLDAAGVPPNDPMNSHQAIAILENLGFETRYAGTSASPHQEHRSVAPVAAPKQEDSILEIFSRITGEVPEDAWKQLPAELSKNVDHYAYGIERDDE